MTNPLDLQDLPEDNSPELLAEESGSCVSVISVVLSAQ